MGDIVKRLTPTELSELDQYEDTIKRGLATFAEVGNALLAIRESKLYREQHGTFEAYCRDKWGMSRPRAYQLIESANVIGNLSTIVDKPATESQARPLAKLPAADQAEAWTAAVLQATQEGRKVTAADVENEVAEIREDVKRRRMVHVAPCDGMQFARMAIMDLEKIQDDDTEREQAFNTVKEWISENE